MNLLKPFLLSALLVASAPAFAQFSNKNDGGKARRSATSGSYRNADNKSYQRVEISYNPLSINIDTGDDDDDDYSKDLTGFSVGYTKGFSILKEYPLFVEVGAQLTYAWWSEDAKDDGDGFEDLGGDELFDYDPDVSDVADGKSIKNSAKYLGLSIPVNLAYKFAIPNSQFTVTPFVGITLIGNIISSSKTEVTYDITYYDTDETVTKTSDKEYDNFDKKEVGKDAKWDRFQIGWNIGAGVNYKNYYAGLKYGSDLTEVAEETKKSNWAITVGYSF